MGANDSLADPTCGTEKTLITGTSLCSTFLNWNASDALCISGTIPTLPPSPTVDDDNANWGVAIGLNATEEPNIGTLGQTYSTIAFTLIGSPQGDLRAHLHRKGDPDGTTFCSSVTSGTPIPLTSFSTTCYDRAKPGLALTTADVPNIDKLNVQVNSTSSPVTISNLCLTGIAFTKSGMAHSM
jgi:hypothetical protein